MSNIALGRYLPTNSWLHHTDPRMKLICMILLMVSVFLPIGWLGYGLLFVVLFSGYVIAKIKPKYIVTSLKPMLFMLVFLLVINVFMIKEGVVWLSIFDFPIYSQAILQTLFIVTRLVLMIMVTTLLTSSTKPLDLTLGIEDLLKPLKPIGVPAHEIALMISIALRFIPTLIEEAQRIMKAQSSRGVDFDEGKFREKIRGILSLIVPLFVSAFQRAEDLADAMEARGYVPSQPRTRYKQLKITSKDWILLSCVLLVLVGLILLAFVL